VIGVWLLAPGLALAAEGTPAAPPAPAAPAPRVIDRAAERLMVDFCALMKAAERFSFALESSYDEVLKSGTRVQYHKSSAVTIERPGRLRVDAEGDKGPRSYWYDGRSVTVFDPERAYYAVLPAPDTLDAMLDAVAARGLVIPLDDLAHSKPCAGLAEHTREGRYAGLHYFNGAPHHHLLFITEAADIQLWLDASDIPLLRKVVIDYRDRPGVPRFEGVLTEWDFDPVIDPTTFTFTPPAGAKQIEFRAAGTPAGGKTP
jgi:hypothetical protein